MMKKFLTSKEAADYLRIEEEELQRIVGKGKISSYKIGGVYTRFKVDDLNLYRHKTPSRSRQRYPNTFLDRVKDFFYFNDFYIFSFIAVIVILFFIFK
ncbi:helix-turn-helix domain-containing protein [Candidatus Omnitrophota bacterium]